MINKCKPKQTTFEYVQLTLKTVEEAFSFIRKEEDFSCFYLHPNLGICYSNGNVSIEPFVALGDYVVSAPFGLRHFTSLTEEEFNQRYDKLLKYNLDLERTI